MASRRERDFFWSTIPPRGRLLFFGAVFCVFAPAIILPVTFERPPLSAILIALLCSGLIGMFWAMAFTRSMWFLIAALGLQMSTIFGFARAAPGWLWPQVTGFDPAGAASLLMVVLGYALFVVFINTEGKRSVRERTELALAQQIHAALVPPIALDAHGYQVLGRSTPSAEVGGDLVAARPRADGIDLDLGDVTGHGVRSGVVMAMTLATVHTARARGAALGGVLAEANDMLADLTDPGMFMTFAAIRAEPGGVVRYALAGHLPILHWSARSRQVSRLENESLPLGVAPGIEFPERTAELGPGDLLVVLTDGFIEIQDRDGCQLGLDGFEQLLAECAERPIADVFGHLTTAAGARGRAQDDQTLLLIRRM